MMTIDHGGAGAATRKTRRTRMTVSTAPMIGFAGGDAGPRRCPMKAASRLACFCLLAALAPPLAARPAKERRADPPLPRGAIARLGLARMVCGHPRGLTVSSDGAWVRGN